MSQRVKLGDVAEQIKDKINKDNTSLEYYIGGEHIESGRIVINKKAPLKGSTIGPAFHMHFMPGDVLLMSRNPHLCKASMVDFEGICSDVSYIVRTKDESVFAQRLLPFVVQTKAFWRFAEENKRGGMPFFLNWKDFAEFEFNLPDPSEQEKIADLLWAAEKTKEAYEAQVALTDELVKSQFIEMFEGKDYPICHLSDECEVITKGTTPTTIGYNFTDDGVRFVKIENITEESKFVTNGMMYISEDCNMAMKRSQLKEGDILFSIAGAIGRCAVVTKDILPANINQALAIVRLKKNTRFNRDFLLAALKSAFVEKQYLELKRGAAQLNLSLKDVGNFKVPVPPETVQQAFVEFYCQSDKSC